jgi:predicted PurR-regulated permease PerM
VNTTKQHLRFWLIGLALFLAALWILSGMLLPFVAALVIAYALDPWVDVLERVRLPRAVATVIVLILFVLILIAVALLLVPVVNAQVVRLINVLPDYIQALRRIVEPLVKDLLNRLSPADVERLRGAIGQYSGDVMGLIANLASKLFASGIALFDVLSIVFITPVVAFYLLRDWDRLVASVDRCLPVQHAETIHQQIREIDRTLAGFMRGQAMVCLGLGLFYAVALTLAGLDFGLVIGLLAGVLSFIPYVGTIFGFVASTGLALVQFPDLWSVAIVVGIFIVGQAIEGNVLTPLWVGDKVGLHPVWVMFALLAGASLFGFLGVLVAVPVASVIGVLTRFALQRYLASDYYGGAESP